MKQIISLILLLLTNFLHLRIASNFSISKQKQVATNVIERSDTVTVDEKNKDINKNKRSYHTPCSGDLGGNIWKDDNANGIKNTYETVTVGDVVVTVYDCNGNRVAVDTSDVNGDWSIDPTGINFPVRVEFNNLPPWAYWSLNGPDAATSVQFISAATCDVNAALSDPANYCESNPTMVTPCYVQDGSNNEDVIVKFSYDNEGTATQDKATVAYSQQVGSVWGTAYSKNQKLIYTAAILKRHIPLGPEGLDAIYTVDPFSGVPNATPWLELTDDLGIAVSSISAEPQYHTNATREVNMSPQYDTNAFQDVGKVGLGDIELSLDEQTLYVVNLYNKHLYAISTVSKTVIGSFPIPDPGCSNGEARPWAIGESNGQIFVGVTCDGSSSGVPSNLLDNSGVDNLSASVYRLDGSSFTQVLSFPLNYQREVPFEYAEPDLIDHCDDIDYWKPWLSVVPATCADMNIGYPTPLLSDIEFADNGDMILGFIDRTGLQFGEKNYGLTGTTLYSMYAAGDILKACQSGAGWIIENTSTGCSSTGGLAINTWDSNGYPVPWGFLQKPGEFYEGDFFHGDGNYNGTGLSYFPSHPEIVTGGLAVVPGTNEVMATSYDPVTGAANYGTGGVITLNNTSGQRPRNGYELYRTGETDVTQGKGIGLGDLEALCSSAPNQIGNYVWYDEDSDGVQDPCEMGIQGVNVSLYEWVGGTPTFVASTTTDADGSYYFTDYEEHGMGYDTLTPGASYYVVVGENGQYNTSSNLLTIGGMDYYLTSQNTGEGNNPDLNDSDAYWMDDNTTTIYGFPVDTITIDATSFVDHSLDFGFSPPPTCFNIGSSIASQEICHGMLVDTLAVTTTYTTPNSIAFVLFSNPQTDSIAIYTSGIGIDTIPIVGGTNTVRLLNVSGFTNNSTIPDTFYVYGIVYPTPDSLDCRPYEEIKVIVHPMPSISALTNDTICEGGAFTESNLTTSLTNNISVTYQWYDNDGANNTGLAAIDEQTTTTLTALPTAVGTYSYRVEATSTSHSACVISEVVNLTINANPTILVNDLLNCTSHTATATAIVVEEMNPYTYSWSGPFITNPGDVSNFITSIPGNYMVTVTDENGCTGTDSGSLSFKAATCLPVSFKVKRGKKAP